jgi:hypothetical protein
MAVDGDVSIIHGFTVLCTDAVCDAQRTRRFSPAAWS